MEQDNLTNHIASIILQTEGALTARVSFPSRSSKRLTVQFGRLGRSIFFVIIAFHLGKLCHDLNGQTDHIHDQAQQRENEREQCESLQQIHSISLPSPSRLRAGYFQKSFLPDLCLFYVEIEKPAIRDRKHDHQFCNQRLICIMP